MSTIDRRNFLKIGSMATLAGIGQVIKSSEIDEEPKVLEVNPDAAYVLIFEEAHDWAILMDLYEDMKEWLRANGLDERKIMILHGTGPVQVVEIKK